MERSDPLHHHPQGIMYRDLCEGRGFVLAEGITLGDMFVPYKVSLFRVHENPKHLPNGPDSLLHLIRCTSKI